jgi:hypothetical protein
LVETPEQRRRHAKLAALSRWSRDDAPRAGTEKAREAFIERFERQVDPNHVLPEGQRRRAAKNALAEHMLRLSLAAARARAKP